MTREDAFKKIKNLEKALQFSEGMSVIVKTFQHRGNHYWITYRYTVSLFESSSIRDFQFTLKQQMPNGRLIGKGELAGVFEHPAHSKDLLPWSSIRISNLDVNYDIQRHGFGSLLMKELMRFATHHSVKMIWGILLPGSDEITNERLKKFYERHGFVIENGKFTLIL